MRLNDSYDAIRSQILLLDPLPGINRAYSMIQRVEKQRQVTSSVEATREIDINVSRNQMIEETEGGSNAFVARGVPRNMRDNKKTKSSRFYTHCQRTDHTVDQCFKLVGYPDWYEGQKDTSRVKKPTRIATNVFGYTTGLSPAADNHMDDVRNIGEGSSGRQMDVSLINAIAQEMLKLVNNKQYVTNQQPGNLSHYARYAGKSLCSSHLVFVVLC